MEAAGKFMPETRISPRIYHVGYVVADAQKTEDFYKMLGFTETWRGGANPQELSWINMKVPDGEDYVQPLTINTGVNKKRQVNMYDPDGTRVEIMEPNTVTGQPTPSSTAPPPPASTTLPFKAPASSGVPSGPQ